MISVLATREGLIGKHTSSGYVIDTIVPYVALPSVLALHRFVKITNPAMHVSTYGIVLDVGPHYTNDDAYVLDPTGQTRPRAELLGTDDFGRIVTNRAGIDLGDAVWHRLAMTDNSNVIWEFLL